jgi:hypothetical protein
LSIHGERATNGEYIAGEKKIFGHSWSPEEPSEDRSIKHRENTFMPIKTDRIIQFCSTFFLKFGIDDGQQNMDTSDLSAIYVSWNPGKKLVLKILISRFGNLQIPNQACGINVLTLDYLQLRGDFLHSSHLARRDFS